LIDGKMRRAEWIRSPGAFLKTDFEHHGMGKNELNVVDPAYDLAEAILHIGLSTSEERQLLSSYVEQCSDSNVEERIFLSKMLAGLEALQQALGALNHPELSSRHQEFNRHYLSAWNFLTLLMTRFCGQHCSRPHSPQWHSPLAVLDVDGVLDRRVFGFPSTTAAGIQALSLLHAHDFAVAVNTARSVGEVKEYCQAYGLAGGVAEYGSYLWDAVGKQGRVQVSPKAAGQLQRIREALRQIPGIFVDDAYQYSIRTYTFEAGGSTPLPTPLLRQLLASLKADRLRFQRNQTDTAIVAKEVDKGTGLLALVEWVGQRQAETLAIGDSEADLAMFRVASRCFAPSQISCRRLAERLGCQISDRAYQAGLLRIVSSLVHPDGSRCHRCVLGRLSSHLGQSAFMQLLEVADCPRPLVRLQAIIDFLAFHFLPKRAQGRKGFMMQAIQEKGALAQANAKA
jgi:hydroxymethylpyrimidine pyrophosphatase-like HAD family hydrolase